MKALYLDLNIRYHNPNRGQIPYILQNVFYKLDIYGPGYASNKTLNNGIDKFVDNNGPYDFIISNEMIIFALDSQYYIEPSKKDFINMYKLRFPSNLLKKEIIEDMYYFFINTKIKKIAYFIQLDFYNLEKSKIDFLESINNMYYITFGKDVICNINNLENIKKESFGSKANDNWYDFVNKNLDKIISLPHFIDEIDSKYTPIENRKYIVNVPGVNYWYRKSIINSLNYSFERPKNRYMKIYSLMDKLKLKPFSYELLNDFYNYIFRRNIANSMFTITCGSALKWPLNKFFEIPAEGSVLICNPFFNMRDLGYEDGINYISLKDPEDINKVIKELSNNLDKVQEIASNGRSMVIQKHSVVARIFQIKNVLKFIINNPLEFNGAYWKNGKFIIYEK